MSQNISSSPNDETVESIYLAGAPFFQVIWIWFTLLVVGSLAALIAFG